MLPGSAGEVRLVDIGDPGVPRADFVRVRMVRMPVNPADLLAIDGAYAFPVAPHEPLGAEGVGRVEAVGDAVDDLAPGDLVLPLTRGNWCALRLLPRSDLIALPRDIELGLAAMLRINPATAWLMLDALGVANADTIVQNAAGSAVAAWVRTFAHARGVRVIDVVRRADCPVTNALIDGPDLAERVRAAAGGSLAGALDCVAGDASGRMAACLRPGGRLIVFGHLSGAPVTIPSRVLTGGGLAVSGFSLRPAEAALGRAGVRRLFEHVIAALPLAPAAPVRAVLPLVEAERAVTLARLAGGGRVHLAP